MWVCVLYFCFGTFILHWFAFVYSQPGESKISGAGAALLAAIFSFRPEHCKVFYDSLLKMKDLKDRTRLDLPTLATHPSGSRVMEAALEHASPSQCQQLMDSLTGNWAKVHTVSVCLFSGGCLSSVSLCARFRSRWTSSAATSWRRRFDALMFIEKNASRRRSLHARRP